MLAVAGAGLICVALYLLGRNASRPSEDVPAGIFGSTGGGVGILLLWFGWWMFVPRVRTGPDGLGIRLMVTRRPVAWEDLIGFERVEMPDGNGNPNSSTQLRNAGRPTWIASSRAIRGRVGDRHQRPQLGVHPGPVPA